MAKQPDDMDPSGPKPPAKPPTKPNAKPPATQHAPAHHAPAPPPSDDAIDLGANVGEGDLSGISVVEWAALVEEPAPPAPAPPTQSAPIIDSPSDADILAMADRPAAPTMRP